MTKFNVDGKYILIAGGSKGLGLNFALELAAKGANIIVIARGQQALDLAREKILFARRSPKQTVEVLSVDLCDPLKIKEALQSLQPITPDVLICTAGGAFTHCGFLADIEPERIRSSIEKNYLTAAYPAQAIIQRWLSAPNPATTRHIVFTSSIAGLVALPGYDAYGPAKAAIRSLADHLRTEMHMYGPPDMYRIHCCFPGTFTSDAFFDEQAEKPTLTKILEETDIDDGAARQKFESAASVAKKFIAALERGDGDITVDTEGRLLLNSMRGTNPRDGWGIGDWIWGNVANSLLWLVQRRFDRTTKDYGIKNGFYYHQKGKL